MGSNKSGGVRMRKFKGFNIPELAIVILVLSILSYIGIQSYGSDKESREVDEIVESVLFVKNKIVDHFIDKRTYLDISDEYAYVNKLYHPKWAFNESGQCITSYGRTCKTRLMDAGSYPGNINAEDGFVIKIRFVPTKYCESLISKLNDSFEFILFGAFEFKSHSTPFANSTILSGCEEVKKASNLSRIALAHY